MEMLLDLSTMGSLGLDTALASPWIKTEPMLMGIDSAVFGGSAADADAAREQVSSDRIAGAASYYGSSNPLYLQGAVTQWPLQALKNSECSSDTSCLLVEHTTTWAPSATHSGCSGQSCDSGSESLAAETEPAAVAAGAGSGSGTRVVRRSRARRHQQQLREAPAGAPTRSEYAPYPAPQQRRHSQSQQQPRQPRKRAEGAAAAAKEQQPKPRAQQQQSRARPQQQQSKSAPRQQQHPKSPWGHTSSFKAPSLSGVVMPFDGFVKSYRMSLPEINAIIKSSMAPAASKEVVPSASNSFGQ